MGNMPQSERLLNVYINYCDFWNALFPELLNLQARRRRKKEENEPTTKSTACFTILGRNKSNSPWSHKNPCRFCKAVAVLPQLPQRRSPGLCGARPQSARPALRSRDLPKGQHPAEATGWLKHVSRNVTPAHGPWPATTHATDVYVLTEQAGSICGS